MKFANEKIIFAADMSASFSSDPILLDQIYGYSFQAVFTGLPNGIFKLQCSNDNVKLPVEVSQWSDVGSTSQAISAAGDLFYNIDAAHYKWVRIVYTRSSGSGSCDVVYFAKGA
jgi:hypothetical protein